MGRMNAPRRGREGTITRFGQIAPSTLCSHPIICRKEPKKTMTAPFMPGIASGLAFATILTLGATATASADSGGWEFEAAPYLWAASLDGTVRAGPSFLPSANVDWSASDILSHLDIGAMGALEGQKGRWGFVIDAIYVELSNQKVTPNIRFASVDAEVKEQMYALFGTYRVVEGPTKVDALAGARYVDIRSPISAVLPTGGIVSVDAGDHWWDPYVGVRVIHPLNERWSVLGWGLIGGFGAGSDFAWDVIAAVNYQFSPTIIGKLGFRYLDMDYDGERFAYDAGMGGPFLGVGIRF